MVIQNITNLADKAVARLRTKINKDTPADVRTLIYTNERVRAKTEPLGLDESERLQLRIAIEQAIHQIEALHSEPRQSELGVFSALMPTEMSSESTASLIVRASLLPQAHGRHNLIRQLLTLCSLWALNMKAEVSNDRFGWIWWILEPVLQILMITIVILLLEIPVINDMKIIPFAIIGVMIWLSARQAIMLTMFWGGPLVNQSEHPRIRRAHIVAVKAARALLVYTFVGSGLLMGAILTDRAPSPENPITLLLAVITTWLLGVGVGAILGAAALRYNSMRRFVGPILRITGLTSGLFFVSEQLPPLIGDLILWNPIIHGIQLARSAYFIQYQSVDADWLYLSRWTIAVLAIGVTCFMNDERQRSRYIR